MNQAGRTLLIAVAALVVPPLVCIGLQWDHLKEAWEVDPGEAQGYVLYFTAPG